ncbi:MAG: EamA family transporter RarD [Desulfovibrionales bacterium]
MKRDTDQTSTGLAAGLAAFLAWGLLPVYWKAVQTVPAFEILCHRIVWSAVFSALILTFQKRWAEIKTAFQRSANRRYLLLSGSLVATNWGVYIWAVNSGHVVQASLGYYINPLVNVILGFLFFGDRPRPLQKVAILAATLGVLNIVVSFGRLPWISLVLAFSFGLYGLARKKMKVESLPGLFIETTALAIPAGGYLLWLAHAGTGALGQAGWTIDALLLGAGAVTSMPLLAFTFAARRLSLVTVGILQYLAPTCMFLLGVFAYGEPFTPVHLITFLLIWVGVAIYTVEGIILARRHPLRNPVG